jgi:hypothetical protein
MLVFFVHFNSPDMTADNFKELLLLIFTSTQSAIAAAATASTAERLVVLVFTLCHQFIELRHSHASGPGKSSVPAHVVPALDAMIGIDTCTDVEVIFRLVEVKLCTANTISFDDLPDPETETTTVINISKLRKGDKEGLLSMERGRTGSQSSNNSAGGQGNLNSSSHAFATGVDPAVSGNTATDTLLDFSVHSNSNSNVDRSAHSGAPAASSAGGVSAVPQQPDLPAKQKLDASEVKYLEWSTPRLGIHRERAQSELSRLFRYLRSSQILAVRGQARHFIKIKRKVELEMLRLPLRCQWKLGVAHEV